MSQKNVKNPSTSTEGYSGYADYFSNKELQQLESDEKFRLRFQVENNISNPYLFQNCTIYVNGRTIPSRFDLHKMIVLHGGKFKHYLSGKTAVTHIVATELNASKKNNLANLKVVHPNWITESIARGKLLPWQNYTIITGSKLQKKITDFSTILNCMDPNFIASFFNASRLHHLSNWKFQLREEFIKRYVPQVSAGSERKNYDKKCIFFHVDFDCFFAQVSTRIDGQYDIKKTPIAISHGINNSDISSCNYLARSYGVHNGMWVSTALELCPGLVVLDYEFDEYEKASYLFYQALQSTGLFDMVLPISIDEAIGCMQVNPDLTEESLKEKCQNIRKAVFEITEGYSVSIGCSTSILLARLALRRGKPDGYHIALFSTDDEIHEFIDEFKLSDLPGIGYSTKQKIQDEFGKLDSVGTLRLLLDNQSCVIRLMKCIGSKNSANLQNSLSGKDDDESIKMVDDPYSFFQKKSLSVEINYAIRFKSIDQVDTFIDRLSLYLWDKLQESGMVTGRLVLKLMKRAKGAPIDPPKYMGMGKCDSVSKASTLGAKTDKLGTIASEFKTLFRLLSVPPEEVRGIGIQFHKLAASNSKPKNDITTGLVKILEANSEFNEPHTPQNTTYSSSVKDYWDRHLKRSCTPFRYDFPDELDPEFMSNLPKDIQDEIRSHHKVTKRAKTSLRNRLYEDPQKQIKQTQDLHFIHGGTLVPQLQFQGLQSSKQISGLLIDWVDNTIEDGPHEKDLELFKQHLAKLSSQGRSHLILQLLKTIKERLAEHYNQEPKGLPQWEHYLLRVCIPILNQSRSDAGYHLTFDL